MTSERRIVIIAHVVWFVLLSWCVLAPRGTFPNTVDPMVLGIPWSLVWLMLLAAGWFLLLPLILRDSIRGQEDQLD